MYFPTETFKRSLSPLTINIVSITGCNRQILLTKQSQFVMGIIVYYYYINYLLYYSFSLLDFCLTFFREINAPFSHLPKVKYLGGYMG